MNNRVVIPSATRKQVAARDNHACLKCGRRDDLEIHHLVAVFDGGTNDPANLATLCHICHREWVHVENNLAFALWLSFPPAAQLVLLLAQSWPADISAAEYQKAIMNTHAALRDLRTNEV